MKNVLRLLLIISILTGSFITTAQKLPNIQGKSQWLPSTVKIDGKLTEWNDMLEAGNRATAIEYTLANDDKNLYLAIRSQDKGATAKIMAGGVTFMINAPGKSVNEVSVITFPVTEPGYKWSNSDKNWYQSYKILTDSADIQNEIAKFRDIKVFGLKGVWDTLLSVYNEQNIKNKLTFTNGVFTSELVIPFELIGLSPSTSAAFAYTIRLNGVTPPIRPGAPPPPVIVPNPNASPAVNERIIINNQIRSPTDLSGKYTLAKK